MDGNSAFQASAARQLVDLMEPVAALSRYLYIWGIIVIPLALLLVFLYKRHCESRYDSAPEASPEEMLGELEREFGPVRRTTIRTQVEYLPFLFECVRENVDSGFEDPQVISLLRRIGFHRPGDERAAVFSVVSGGRRCELQMRWVRDDSDRIRLSVTGAPPVIRALRDHKKRIPRAGAGFPADRKGGGRSRKS